MSGGSFDYLYLKLDYLYLDDIEKISDGLQSMSEWLMENGKSEVSVDLLELREKFIAMNEDIQKLASDFPTDIIKDAEWWCSGDIGEESFDKSVVEYRRLKEDNNES